MDSMTTLVLAIAALLTTNVVAVSLDRDRRRPSRRRPTNR
jgi:hypothetical protein